MGKVDIQVVRNYFLKSEEVGGYMEDLASNIAQRCGEGYESDVNLRETRYVASVFAKTREAGLDNYRNNTILKNLRG